MTKKCRITKTKDKKKKGHKLQLCLKGVVSLDLDRFKNHPYFVHPLCHEKE